MEADEAEGVLAAIPCDDAVQRPGTGVVALGALPFLDSRQGHLIVPRFTMGIAQEPDGATHRWATAVGPTDLPLPATEELFDAVIWQYGSRPESAASGDVAITALTTDLSRAEYQDAVAGAVAIMRAPDATLDKVVLSRRVTAELDGPLPLSAVLRRLRAHEPACTIFSFPVPDGTFFGASPELLMARHGRRITCHPLAGTVARGQTARADADAQGGLAGSSKDRSEHRFVVDGLSAALRPLCDELTVPAEPSLVAFRSVAHLGTRIEGHLRDNGAPVGVLESGRDRASDPGGRGHAQGRGPGHHRHPGAGSPGLLGRPGRLGRRQRRRRVDDRHPQRPPASRRPDHHPACRCGRGGRLRPRGRGGRDRRQADVGPGVPGPRRLGTPALSGGAATAARRTAAGASGIRTITDAPPVVDEVTSADPPRASAMARTMANPNPLPGPVRPGFPREKRSKTRAARAGSMPGPLSETRMTPMPRSECADTVTLEPGGGVGQGIAHQVVGHLGQALGVPEDDDLAAGGHRQLVRVIGRVGVLDHVGADAMEIDRVRPERPAPIQLGQEQEVLDQAPHARRFLLDPLQRSVDARLVGEPAPAQQFGVPPDRRQGRAELVGGVGHELAQALLGGRLLGEGLLDLGEHLVEGGPEASDLGGRRLLGHPSGEVARGDGVGRLGHFAQGPQAAPDQPQGQPHHDGEDGDGGQPLHPAQRGQGVVGGVERERDVHGALGHAHGHHPVAPVRVPLAPDDDRVRVGTEGPGIAAELPARDVRRVAAPGPRRRAVAAGRAWSASPRAGS